ncbi:hypothetical protein F511_19473 [Dorcoceras hygrometricum]|uniref:Uncharacterized protein n=1 Tax=Dorcoceras hygrometricum TaxID=472368 RepID=A0A2Z7D2L7_9LAMI|nr:hypothetical protein F511_19473 [Dorcoceras hygrometricum]
MLTQKLTLAERTHVQTFLKKLRTPAASHVYIAIGSLATFDLPMVVDLIGIYVLKGPYCTLTTTNWFLQELSVIPRGSWGDVARRFTMIRWANLEHTAPSSPQTSHRRRPPPSAAAAAPHRRPPPMIVIGLVSISVTRRIRSSQNLSDLLVQIDGGIAFPVVDLTIRSTAAYLLKCQFPCETGWSQVSRRQQGNDSNILYLLVQIDGGIAFPVVDLTIRSTAAYLLKCQFPCETGWSQVSRRQQAVAYTHFLSAVSAIALLLLLYFLPGCEGEWQYSTLISLLGFVSPHAPSGMPDFTAGRGFNPAGGAPGGG